MTETSSQPLTVYYDGDCPLCAKEIALYQGLKGADAICWENLRDHKSDHGREQIAPDLTLSDGLARFHVRDQDGTLRSGGAAFAHLWKGLPATAWIGRIAAKPAVSWILERLYRLFLGIRPFIAARMAKPAATPSPPQSSAPAAPAEAQGEQSSTP